MECDIGWEMDPTGQAEASQNPSLTVPMWTGQKLVMAILDMGSSVSMIQAHLVPDNWPILWHMMVDEVERQVNQWPVVRILGLNQQGAYNGCC